MDLLILVLVGQWNPKLSYYFNWVVSCFGIYFKIGHFVYFYVHKQLNLGFLYVVVFFIQGFIFKHLFIIFFCMKVWIHTHITIVKCCLGPLLPTKIWIKAILNVCAPKYYLAKFGYLVPYSLKLSQRHFIYLKSQNTRFMAEQTFNHECPFFER